MRAKQKTKLIALSKDAKHAHRLWSVWLSLAVVVVSVLEALHQFGPHILPLWVDVIPERYYPIIVAALGTLGIVARVLRQACLSHPEVVHEDEEKVVT